MKKNWQYGLGAGLAALLALGLVGCGGNDSLPSKVNINKVFVMGDSLADVGTFGGLKFTVQDPVNPKNSLVWPQIVANNFGLDGAAQCNFFSIGASGVTMNPACSNYAVGGARIVNKPSDSLPTVGAQLAARAQAPYASTDLLLVDGGGNDAADLVTAYLTVAAGGPAAAYQSFLMQQLDAATLGALFTQDPTGALAAGAYMQKLADTYFDAIKLQALDKGAVRVGVLNIPDITITPRFQAVLGTMSAQQSAMVQGGIRQWLSAFNAQLKSRIGTDNRIALVDFYTDFQDEVAHPEKYGLTNTKDPVCTTTMSEAFGQFPCISSALDTTPNKTTGWWKNYAFSDGFHPTPFAHGLLAASVSRALARAGWL
jgi:phospholipase/lecithinase/hemolysin